MGDRVPPRGQKCEACRRTVRTNNKRALFLFLRTGEKEAWVCGERCLNRYNESA